MISESRRLAQFLNCLKYKKKEKKMIKAEPDDVLN
jgi:hypothetical protein